MDNYIDCLGSGGRVGTIAMLGIGGSNSWDRQGILRGNGPYKADNAMGFTESARSWTIVRAVSMGAPIMASTWNKDPNTLSLDHLMDCHGEGTGEGCMICMIHRRRGRCIYQAARRLPIGRTCRPVQSS